MLPNSPKKSNRLFPWLPITPKRIDINPEEVLTLFLQRLHLTSPAKGFFDII